MTSPAHLTVIQLIPNNLPCRTSTFDDYSFFHHCLEAIHRPLEASDRPPNGYYVFIAPLELQIAPLWAIAHSLRIVALDK